MNQKLNILIVSKSPSLHDDIKSSLVPLRDTVQCVLKVVTNIQKGIDAARSLCPDLLFFEAGEDLQEMNQLAEGVRNVSPSTNLVGTFLAGPGKDALDTNLVLEGMRAGIKDFLRRPISTNDLRRLIDRVLQGKDGQTGRSLSGKIITVTSNKGGVGKSTMSANIACALARKEPGEVLLIDASVHLGVLSAMLNLKPSTTLLDAVRQQSRLDETLLKRLATHHENGVDLLASPKSPVDAGEITDQALSLILNLARRAYKYVIVDTFPVIDSLVITALDYSDTVYIVVEGVVPTVLGCAELLALFDELQCPKEKQKIILNRYSDFTGNLTPDLVEERLGRAVNFIVPYTRQSLVAMNLGEPLVTVRRQALPVRRWFHRLVDRFVRSRIQIPWLLRLDSELHFVYEVERIAQEISGKAETTLLIPEKAFGDDTAPQLVAPSESVEGPR